MWHSSSFSIIMERDTSSKHTLKHGGEKQHRGVYWFSWVDCVLPKRDTLMSLHVEFQKVGEPLSWGRKLASNNARGQSAPWMGSCRCDLTFQVQSFHWEKVLGEVWPIFVCFGWGNRREEPQKQQQQGEEDRRCSAERQTRLFIRFCLGLNHCAATEPMKKKSWYGELPSRLKWCYINKDRFTIFMLCSPSSSSSAWERKCMCPSVWFLFLWCGSTEHISRPISYWAASDHQIMIIKLKWTDASLASQLVAPSLYQLQHWGEFSI